MSVFALAIVDRIAETVQIRASAESSSETVNAKGLIHLAIDAVKRHKDSYWWSSSPEDRKTAESFASFVSLVELAVRTGHVRLSDWPDAAVAQEVAPGFRTMSPDAQLLDAFVNRQPSPDEPTRDVVGFAGFESYLMLTHRILRDSAVRDFRNDSWTGAAADDDWAILISPRHFAEAFGTGRIAGVSVTDPSAAIRLLGFLEWLRDIVAGLSGQTDLREGILAHAAGWLDRALLQQQRLDVWVSSMREWDVDVEDLWTPESWSAYCGEVFGALRQERVRPGKADAQVIAAEPPAVQTPEIVAAKGEDAGVSQAAESVVVPSPEKSVAQLVAEGRRSAARDLARSDALAVASSGPVDPVEERSWLEWAETLVSNCVLLAELGDELAASAIVAPAAKRLLEVYGPLGYDVVDQARALLGRARGLANTVTVAPGETITRRSPIVEIQVDQAGTRRNELRARSIGSPT